jgi:uncharacterized protein with GYD domain
LNRDRHRGRRSDADLHQPHQLDRQGRGAFKETVDRAEAGKQLADKFGGSLKEIYWTIGPYDVVAVSEAPDDESATAFALALASQSNVRTTTLRAFDADEMRGIIAKTD